MACLGNKEGSNYLTIALISHDSKVMLKILQARLQQYVMYKLPDAQVGFRKRRGTIYQIANICWIIEKAKEFQKNIYFCFIGYINYIDFIDYFVTVWITTNWKILMEMLLPDCLPASGETCMQVKKQQLELDMEQ